MPSLPDVARRELVEIVGRRHVLVDPDDRAGYERDWTGRFVGATPAVVRPADHAQVAAVVALCRRHGLALVPQGGNTGLVGGSVPLEGEVVVSLRRLDEIGPVDAAAGQVTAGAGATVAALHAAATGAGLRYAVDFAARDTATVGGSVATNAGGVHVMRFGGTRQQLLGVEAVTGTGSHLRQLGGLIKDNTGYDLSSLLCGSEGTLGIVTAARLRLVPRHDERLVALVAFREVGAAVTAVAAWRAGIEGLEAAELMVAAGLDLVCEAFFLPHPFDRSWPVYVLVEVAARVDPTDAVARAVEATIGIGDVAVATDAAHRDALWRYRDDHTAAINSLAPTMGPPHKLDVTLPLGEVAAFMAEVPRRVADVFPHARTWLFGHVGDGNIHVNVTGPAPDDDRVDEVVLTAVAALGGSISAEHGIGRAKARWIHLTRSADELATMAAIKRALDPDGVLNPHAVLP